MTTVAASGSSPSKTDILINARRLYIQILVIFNIIAELVGYFVIQAAPDDPSTKGSYFVLVTVFIVVDCALLILLRYRKSIGIPTTVVLLKILAGMLISASTQYWWFMLGAALATLIAATLAPRWLYIAVNVVVLAQVIYNIATQNQAGVAAPDTTPNVILMLMLIVISVTTRFFANTTQRAASAADRAANLLRAAAETGEDLGKSLNLNEVLPRAAEFIQERFGFYHVQVFLIDEKGENAVLAASTGAIGQKLFERRHSLPVGSTSVIGTVSSTGKVLIARDTDPLYYRNELLPNTRTELAVPIFDGDKIIGALDVQSRRYDTFDTEIVQALQTLGNQLGTYIRNARLFEAQERSSRETKRLFLEAETNLREIQRLNQQLTRQGWEDFIGNRREVGGVTVSDERITNENQWSDALVKAGQTRQPVRETDGHQAVVAVPVMLGGEVIGAIEVESGAHSPDAETVEIIQAVAQRLAVSLDKARLFEESQEATSREQRINEIVGRFQTVSNVDELLRITLEELSQSLGATTSAIRLGAASPVALNGNGETQE